VREWSNAESAEKPVNDQQKDSELKQGTDELPGPGPNRGNDGAHLRPDLPLLLTRRVDFSESQCEKGGKEKQED
jgi:hypothetical protein